MISNIFWTLLRKATYTKKIKKRKRHVISIYSKSKNIKLQNLKFTYVLSNLYWICSKNDFVYWGCSKNDFVICMLFFEILQ